MNEWDGLATGVRAAVVHKGGNLLRGSASATRGADGPMPSHPATSRKRNVSPDINLIIENLPAIENADAASRAVQSQQEWHAMRTHSPGVYEQLRLDILRCRLQPGARLRLEDLRERYKIGFSPVREALMHLEAEGLVALEHNKGFRVSPVSKEHLEDIGKVRIEVEKSALRWAIEQGDVQWEAELLAAFHRLSSQSKVDPNHPGAISESWHFEHRRFHAALVSACNSPLLLCIHGALLDQAERYVALGVSYRERPRDDVSEHKALLDAALARDVEAACALCEKHIERTTCKVLEFLTAGRTATGEAASGQVSAF